MVNVTSPNVYSSTGPQSGMESSNGNGSSRHVDGSQMLQNMAQGAHQTIDRLAEQVTPHVQRLQENMSGATEMLDERADQIREMTDEWMETLRATVRENPLAAVGVALAVGLVVAKLSR